MAYALRALGPLAAMALTSGRPVAFSSPSEGEMRCSGRAIEDLTWRREANLPDPTEVIAKSNWSEVATVRLWDHSNTQAAGPMGQPLTGMSPSVTSVAFSPDDKTLVVGHRQALVAVMSVPPRALS